MSDVLVYDLEATGVDPEKDRMVSLAIVTLDGKTVLSIVVDPGIPMPAGAAAVHGITDEKLAELGARPFRDHADQVQEIIHGKILAGYNSRSYDAVLLDRELKLAGQVGLDLENVVEIDAHRVWIELEPRTLSGAYQHFCGKELAGAHDALEDAKATAAVVASMGAAFGLTADDATNAILTGSRAYGIPNDQSDIDLVVFMEPSQAADLAALMGAELNRTGDARYPGAQFRAGALNVIVETDPAQFGIWVEGTQQLEAKAPVTRDEAVAHFAEMRSKRCTSPS
ncbi:hypothetical protein LCGC14_0663110 [marine sediment metagenome]|uniref:Exonuclease domain-containing protein n=1 Tax=marine sediment metagenome TaxID=412755 RepID=A0A0F9U188_9ZZZZ